MPIHRSPPAAARSVPAESCGASSQKEPRRRTPDTYAAKGEMSRKKRRPECRNALVSDGKRRGRQCPITLSMEQRGWAALLPLLAGASESVQLELAGNNKETASCLISLARRSRTLLK